MRPSDVVVLDHGQGRSLFGTRGASRGPAPVILLIPSRPRGRRRLDLGRATAFSIEEAADTVFDRRLVLPDERRGDWIVLTYRDGPAAAPQRPMLRLLRAGGVEDLVLPGLAEARAHWLGLLAADVSEIRIAAGPGFVLERVGRRSHAEVLRECLGKDPLRFVSALYEGLRGDARRYRDTLRGACAVTPRGAYTDWVAARTDIPGHTKALSGAGSDTPIQIIVLAREGGGDAIAQTVASLIAQTDRDWEATVLHDVGPPTGVADAEGRVVHHLWRDDRSLHDLAADRALCLLEAGDRLAPEALSRLASGASNADLVYADEIGSDGTVRLKPDWSPDFAIVSGYQGRPSLASATLLARLPDRPCGPIADFLIALETIVGCAAERVVHIPRVLARTFRREVEAATRTAVLTGARETFRLAAEPVMRDGVLDLLWPLPLPPPLASIVVPSRNRLDLIAKVSRGVLHETDYPAIELIVVDNGSTDPGVLAHYETLRCDARVRIVAFDDTFNFSAMVNAGVAASAGSIVVLLNNDVAVLQPGWLDAMVRQASRPDVGAVGAKLLYGNGTLQHAGVVVGLGGRAGHILRRRPADAPGHLGQMRVAHEVSAVTAACLAVARSKYDAIGGFDAEAFPIDFNDVDFCLRLGSAGYKTVWTPAATLAHWESVSRGPSIGAARVRFEREAARFAERWRDVIRHDPFYHPALSLTTFGEDLE